MNETEYRYFKTLKLFNTPDLRQAAKINKYTKKFICCN